MYKFIRPPPNVKFVPHSFPKLTIGDYQN